MLFHDLYCHICAMGSHTFLFANVYMGYMDHSSFQLESSTSVMRVLMLSLLQGSREDQQTVAAKPEKRQ